MDHDDKPKCQCTDGCCEDTEEKVDVACEDKACGDKCEIGDICTDVSDEASDVSEEDECEEEEVVIGERRRTRSLIFHLLYALEADDYKVSVEEVVEAFNKKLDTEIPVEGEIVDTVKAVIEKREEFDAILKPLLVNWKLDRLGCCTRLIMYYAIWELQNKDTPSNVVINEAIELTKSFSEKDAYKFVNGLLDNVVKNLNKDKADS